MTSYNRNKFFANLVTDWDRHEWMQEHGEWASAEWAGDREARDKAREALADALREAADEAADGKSVDLEFLTTLHAECVAAEKACEGAVEPDESDYIAEGEIDPDEVGGDPGTKVWSQSWAGWDCTEGEAVYLSFVDGALRVVHRWWRAAYGQRHDRDLWRIAISLTEAQDIAQALDACREGDLEVILDDLDDLVEQDAALARRVREEATKGGALARLLDRILPPVEEDEDDEDEDEDAA